MSSALAEPLSPELVLVADDLREAAIAALPARVWQLYAPAPAPEGDVPAAVPVGKVSVVLQALLYVAWHAVIGAFLGFGVFVTVALGLLALRLIA